MTKPIVQTISASGVPARHAEVHSLLDALIEKRLEEVAEIEQMVQRYERRIQKEEQAYRTMSTLRKFLSGKKPDHHAAVEYIHYVKKPLEKARHLREEIARYETMKQNGETIEDQG
ncbi:hypothetical protein [Cohnella sp. JJ-181]|uniref:hypothetical protein n=1 Tax=Cohnella rhizoplanae TaxID=2974897 RepID=UPI0022FF9B60|nr:hypothetical protein [Cohnella sp. JJ-181]CAI6046793.1 hypothetical protein COHCIP112018_01311 [Cohnella sp. JJ-181]